VDDGTAFCPKKGELDPSLYIQSLIGLSNGVKSVDVNLRVTPGGWMSINAFQVRLQLGYEVVHAVVLCLDIGLLVVRHGSFDCSTAAKWYANPCTIPIPFQPRVGSTGTLDGLDLHTYFNVIYAPMSGEYTRSAQYNFHQVLKRNSVTRPVAFYSTEFNFNREYEAHASTLCHPLTWFCLGTSPRSWPRLCF
jgi:hypothetical protein